MFATGGGDGESMVVTAGLESKGLGRYIIAMMYLLPSFDGHHIIFGVVGCTEEI